MADRGYFKGPEIKACDEAGIETYVPKPMTSNAKAEGRFGKLTSSTSPRTTSTGARLGSVRSTASRARRTTCRSVATGQRLPRLPAEGAVHDGQLAARHAMGARGGARCDAAPAGPQARCDDVRRRTIEHVFGTLKHWMGSTHFLTRRLEHVGTEMSLHVLAYNLKRVISVLGIARTLKAVQMAGA